MNQERVQIGGRTFVGRPDMCPLCHNGIQAVLLMNDSHEQSDKTREVVFRCPLSKCNHLFVAYYVQVTKIKLGDPKLDRLANEFHLDRMAPVEARPIGFGNEIADTSPDFVKIYNQAAAAEDYGLKEVCGPGYRKALEFLIKDYLIGNCGVARADVADKWLGKCIKDDVKDTRVQACAKRAVWLGNDETHYKREWTDKDLTHLKDLIDLTVNWIESEIKTARYTQEMKE